MRKPAIVLALAALCGLTATAFGKRAAPAPAGFRASAADAVVVGQVTDVGDKSEKAELYKGDTRDLKVATFKVQSALLGKPGTTVKVGFVVAPPVGGGRPIRPGRFPMVSLAKGFEGCLILTKHPTKKDLYVINSTDDVIGREPVEDLDDPVGTGRGIRVRSQRRRADGDGRHLAARDHLGALLGVDAHHGAA